MTKQNRIFIVGRSGAGKGVLAQAVADKLGWKFINADILGCAGHIGRKTSEILGEEGTKHFNQCLSEILKHQTTQENIVVTTDENIADNEETQKLLKDEFTVYLKVSTAIQVERLANYRPLLPVNDFGKFLDEVGKVQDKHYEQVSSFSLSSDNGDIDAHVQAVVKAFNEKA